MSEFDEKLSMEEEMDILTLTDDDGTEIDFELLTVITYNDEEYAVLLPLNEDETEDDETVIILRVKNLDEETVEYSVIEEEETLNAVFEIFMENFKDEFNFVD